MIVLPETWSSLVSICCELLRCVNNIGDAGRSNWPSKCLERQWRQRPNDLMAISPACVSSYFKDSWLISRHHCSLPSITVVFVECLDECLVSNIPGSHVLPGRWNHSECEQLLGIDESWWIMLNPQSKMCLRHFMASFIAPCEGSATFGA